MAQIGLLLNVGKLLINTLLKTHKKQPSELVCLETAAFWSPGQEYRNDHRKELPAERSDALVPP